MIKEMREKSIQNFKIKEEGWENVALTSLRVGDRGDEV